ncbi:MAG: MFS transporter [Dehalococcoidales bacterium]|nr:MFS transporter [Dehalococcoidales bacterium]
MQSTSPSESHPSITARMPFFYGWIILAVSALALFISGPGQTYSVSIFVDPIISDMGWTRTMVSGMYSAGSLTAGVAMILVGRLLDRYGARTMLAVVGVLFGLAALWMSSVDQPWKLYVGFALMRTLGQGSLTLIPTTLISLWFVCRRGKATAIGSLGGAASGATFPILLHKLVTDTGWRNAWQTLAYVIWIALLLPAILLVRRSPESVGLLPDGQQGQLQNGLKNDETVGVRELNFSLSEATRTRAFWLLIVAGSAFPLIGTALGFHQISLLASKGIPAGVAASVFGVMAPMQIVGIFAAGFLADRYPNRYLLAVGQGLLIIGMLWTFLISSTWQAFLWGGIMGLGAGFTMTVGTVIWPNYFGRLHLGSIRGVATAAMVAFAALGPLPFGLLFDLTGSYSLPILVFVALPVSSLVAALLARPPGKDEAS